MDTGQDRRALEMRKAGATFNEIATVLGVTSAEVIEGSRRALDAEESEGLASTRRLEVERLDRLWRAMYPAALQGNERAARICLDIMDRRAQLLGLDRVQPRLEEDHDRLDELNSRRRAKRTRGMPHVAERVQQRQASGG